MNKRLIIIVIIVISLFALIFIGTYSYNKYEKQNQPEEENNEIYDQDDYVTESEETIEDITIEDIIDRIKEYYADNENTTVVYNETKSGCWYFSDSDNNRYKYCIYNGEIEVIK